MKIAFPISLLIIVLSSPLLGVDVESAINIVSQKPRAYALHTEEASKLLNAGPTQDTVVALLNVIDDDTRGVRKEAAMRLMLALDPFPIKELDAAVATEVNPRNRAYALWFLNQGVKSPADIEKVVAHAKELLNEEQEVFRTYGEAKATAPLGLRGSDAAYNILIQRLPITEKFPLISVSDTMLPERNDLIDKLCTHLSLPLHKWSVLRPREDRGSASDLLQPSLSWITWSFLSVLIIGLIWLFTRKRQT